MPDAIDEKIFSIVQFNERNIGKHLNRGDRNPKTNVLVR